jgi:hypothetical protein
MLCHAGLAHSNALIFLAASFSRQAVVANRHRAGFLSTRALFLFVGRSAAGIAVDISSVSFHDFKVIGLV